MFGNHWSTYLIQTFSNFSGSFPVLSLMVGAMVTRLVPENSPPANITDFEGLTPDQQRVLVASSVTFLMGVFQV